MVLVPGVFEPMGGIAGNIVGVADSMVGVAGSMVGVTSSMVGVTGVLVRLTDVLMRILRAARVVMTNVFDGGFMRTMTTLAAEAAGMNKPRKHEDLQEQGQAQGTEATNRRMHYRSR